MSPHSTMRIAYRKLRDFLGGTQRRKDDVSLDGQLRRIALDGNDIDYRLFRVRRRSIGMQISVSGLTVRAPRWATIRDIEATLQGRAAWIVRTLAEWRARRRDVLPREWRTGAPILYLGNELKLAVLPGRVKTIEADLFNLTVLHPAADDEAQIAAFVTRWLRDEALRLYVPHAVELASRITPKVPTVKLSNARSEWGSCNHRGVIRLSWRLVQLPPDLALYVVAHEVAHLVELNHSPRFWNVAEGLFPGSSGARRALDEWTALLEA